MKDYYLVQWHDSWEPAENLSADCRNLIEQFWGGRDPKLKVLLLGVAPISLGWVGLRFLAPLGELYKRVGRRRRWWRRRWW